MIRPASSFHNHQDSYNMHNSAQKSLPTYSSNTDDSGRKPSLQLHPYQYQNVLQHSFPSNGALVSYNSIETPTQQPPHLSANQHPQQPCQPFTPVNQFYQAPRRQSADAPMLPASRRIFSNSAEKTLDSELQLPLSSYLTVKTENDAITHTPVQLLQTRQSPQNQQQPFSATNSNNRNFNFHSLPSMYNQQQQQQSHSQQQLQRNNQSPYQGNYQQLQQQQPQFINLLTPTSPQANVFSQRTNMNNQQNNSIENTHVPASPTIAQQLQQPINPNSLRPLPKRRSIQIIGNSTPSQISIPITMGNVTAPRVQPQQSNQPQSLLQQQHPNSSHQPILIIPTVHQQQQQQQLSKQQQQNEQQQSQENLNSSLTQALQQKQVLQLNNSSSQDYYSKTRSFSRIRNNYLQQRNSIVNFNSITGSQQENSTSENNSTNSIMSSHSKQLKNSHPSSLVTTTQPDSNEIQFVSRKPLFHQAQFPHSTTSSTETTLTDLNPKSKSQKENIAILKGKSQEVLQKHFNGTTSTTSQKTNIPSLQPQSEPQPLQLLSERNNFENENVPLSSARGRLQLQQQKQNTINHNKSKLSQQQQTQPAKIVRENTSSLQSEQSYDNVKEQNRLQENRHHLNERFDEIDRSSEKESEVKSQNQSSNKDNNNRTQSHISSSSPQPPPKHASNSPSQISSVRSEQYNEDFKTNRIPISHTETCRENSQITTIRAPMSIQLQMQLQQQQLSHMNVHVNGSHAHAIDASTACTNPTTAMTTNTHNQQHHESINSKKLRELLQDNEQDDNSVELCGPIGLENNDNNNNHYGDFDRSSTQTGIFYPPHSSDLFSNKENYKSNNKTTYITQNEFVNSLNQRPLHQYDGQWANNQRKIEQQQQNQTDQDRDEQHEDTNQQLLDQQAHLMSLEKTFEIECTKISKHMDSSFNQSDILQLSVSNAGTASIMLNNANHQFLFQMQSSQQNHPQSQFSHRPLSQFSLQQPQSTSSRYLSSQLTQNPSSNQQQQTNHRSLFVDSFKTPSNIRLAAVTNRKEENTSSRQQQPQQQYLQQQSQYETKQQQGFADVASNSYPQNILTCNVSGSHEENEASLSHLQSINSISENALESKTTTVVDDKTTLWNEELDLHPLATAAAASFQSNADSINLDPQQAPKVAQISHSTRETRSTGMSNVVSCSEDIIEDFAEKLYQQLNIERSVMQLKIGLNSKLREIQTIFPNSIEDVQSYCTKINGALGLQFSVSDAQMVFASERRIREFVKREDVFNVLFDMQNVTPVGSENQSTSSSHGSSLTNGIATPARIIMSEEARKTVRNVLRETLRAELGMEAIRREFTHVRLALFEIIHGIVETSQYSSALTCGELKKFLQVNGYQVRDQEMMMLAFRIAKPNTVRVLQTQFLI